MLVKSSHHGEKVASGTTYKNDTDSISIFSSEMFKLLIKLGTSQFKLDLESVLGLVKKAPTSSKIQQKKISIFFEIVLCFRNACQID